MSIYKGNKKVIALYKGATPIKSVMKGTLSIYNEEGGGDTPDYSSYNLILEYDTNAYPNGTTYKLNNTTYTATSSPWMVNYEDELISFSFENSGINKIVKFPNTSGIKGFDNPPFKYSKLTTINVSDWDLNNINSNKNMLFMYANNAQHIYYPTDYFKNESSLVGAFGFCSNLRNIELTSFNTCTNASHMFNGCSNLTFIDTDWTNDILQNTSYMFKDCSSYNFNILFLQQNFKKIFGGYNLQNVSHMFDGCNFGSYNFPYEDLLEMHFNNVTDISYMFANTVFNSNEYMSCGAMSLGNCQNFSHMFDNSQISGLDFNYVDFGNATDMSYMFANCPNLEYVDFYGVTSFNNAENNGMFINCPSLQYVACDNQEVYDFLVDAVVKCGFDASIVQCDSCTSSTPTNALSVTFESENYNGDGNCVKLNNTKYCTNEQTYNVTLEELGIDNLTNCYQTFMATNLIELHSFPDTSNVENMTNMFYLANKVQYLDLSSFNTSNVKYMSYMFASCSVLNTLNVSGWDVSNVETYDYMFYSCENLSTLILGDVTQEQYDWWYDRLSDVNKQDSVNIEYNII